MKVTVFFQRNKAPAGFVKCTSCAKYASRVKCAAAREGIYFVSHCDEGVIFHNLRSKLFHIHYVWMLQDKEDFFHGLCRKNVVFRCKYRETVNRRKNWEAVDQYTSWIL